MSTTRRPQVHTWETVTSEPQELTERLRVVGGWMYRTTLLGDDGRCVDTSAIFVPDPKTEETQGTG